MIRWMNLENHTIKPDNVQRLRWLKLKDGYAVEVYLNEVNADGTAVCIPLTDNDCISALAEYFMMELD